MRIRIPAFVIEKLERELKTARGREIGGVLVAERLGGDEFLIAGLSVQHSGGSSVFFERDPAEHQAFLADFFHRTDHDYARFNYLGEWHSHPNVDAVPSVKDVLSMQEIVMDPAVNTPFAVLLIARRRLFRGLDLSATEFRPDRLPSPVALLAGDGSTNNKGFNEVRPRASRRLPWSSPVSTLRVDP
ncbi:JAB domain-containing protein similar to deubiquitination enzymes [Stenotrophomonas maltophilia]|nr:Mov34/MPN/PAD-1 family protein [Stenotrophomonas maltophilia]TQM08207.1 JAB domain-containing protein similar to deubiquitination enzymes [Stenotrophomonas maltophilia]